LDLEYKRLKNAMAEGLAETLNKALNNNE